MEDNNIPCLWLLGGMDNHIDSAEATAKVQLSNKIKIAILKNSGHIGFIEEPERSFTLLDSFISSIQGE
jgi:pimeloyl-ACP methyl ester carboxylesterase